MPEACGNSCRAGRTPKRLSNLMPGPGGLLDARGNSRRAGRMAKSLPILAPGLEHWRKAS
eukprot:7936329-Alexandrium_andersonii.AAC.1